MCACSEFGGRTQRKARLTITKGREAEKGRTLIGLKTKLLFSRPSAGKANLHGPCQGSLKYANPEAEVEAGDAWLCKTTILPASRLRFSELKHHPLEIVVNKNTILWFTVASDGDISSWMMRNQCDWSYNRTHPTSCKSPMHVLGGDPLLSMT